MTVQGLLAEFSNETRTTRRMIERIPADKLAWRPHPKSFTAGELASHIVGCLEWVERIVGQDVFDVDPASFRTSAAASLDALLAGFDERVSAGQRALANADEGALSATWRMTMRGKVRVERPKADALRDFTLSHIIHHRGQLSVYLRLLDVPVPGAYGPTADDRS